MSSAWVAALATTRARTSGASVENRLAAPGTSGDQHASIPATELFRECTEDIQRVVGRLGQSQIWRRKRPLIIDVLERAGVLPPTGRRPAQQLPLTMAASVGLPAATTASRKSAASRGSRANLASSLASVQENPQTHRSTHRPTGALSKHPRDCYDRRFSSARHYRTHQSLIRTEDE